MGNRFSAFQNAVGLEEAERIAAEQSDTPELVDQRNHWFDHGELGKDLDAEVNRRAARLLYEVFLYITDKLDANTFKGLLRMTVRLIAVVWVFMPDMLRCKKQKGEEQGKICTLEDMAAAFAPRISRCWISMVAEDASVCFGVFSRNQKKGSSRANYAEAARKAWKVRRERYVKDKTRTRRSLARNDG